MLSEGCVVQIGTPADLQNAGGHYDDLWGIAPEEPVDVG